MIGYDPYDAEPWKRKCEQLEQQLAAAREENERLREALRQQSLRKLHSDEQGWPGLVQWTDAEIAAIEQGDAHA